MIDPQTNTVAYSRDGADQVVSATYNNAFTKIFTRDALGRVVHETNNFQQSFDYTYDNLDRLLQVTSPQGTVSANTMEDTSANRTFQELSEWHRGILSRLLDAPFPGQPELKTQVLTSRFRIIDNNQSLEIFPTSAVAAPVVKTIPVEASAPDEDGVPIQSLLFTRHGLAYMLEILRADGKQVKRLPSAPAFNVTVLEAVS
jgi:YD repeat-containing protein